MYPKDGDKCKDSEIAACMHAGCGGAQREILAAVQAAGAASADQ